MSRVTSTGVKFVSDSALSVGANVLVSLIALANGILISRALGPEGRGAFTILALVPLTLSRIGNLGLGQGMVYGTVRTPDELGVRWGNSVAAATIFGGALALAGWALLATGTVGTTSSVAPWALVLAVATIPLQVFNGYQRQLLLGVDDLVRHNLATLVWPITQLGLMVVLLWGLGWKIDAALAAWAIGIAAETVSGAALLWPRISATGVGWDAGILWQDLRYGIQVYAAVVTVFLLHRFDQFLVDHFLGAEAVGIYSLAVSLIMQLALVPKAVNAALIAKLTSVYADRGSLLEMTPVVSRMLVLVATLAVVALAIAAYPLIPLLYGADFLPAYLPLLILLPSVPLLSGLTVLNTDFRARGVQRWSVVAAAVGLIVNTGLDLVLIPRWGLVGAAVASTIAYLIFDAILVFLFLRFEPGLRVRDLMLPTRKDIARLFELARAGLKRRG